MDTIKYTLRGVSIEQFATLFEPSGNNIQLELNIPIKTNYQERTIAVGTNIQFQEEGKPFLIAEVFCHYIIDKSCWIMLTDNYLKDATLPKDFVENIVHIQRCIVCKNREHPLRKIFSAYHRNARFQWRRCCHSCRTQKQCY